MGEILESLYSSDGRERVHIVRRGNGSFGFEVEFFSDYPTEMCWCSRSQFPLCICDTHEAALREARARVNWLNEDNN